MAGTHECRNEKGAGMQERSSLAPEASARLLRPPGLADFDRFWGVALENSPVGVAYRFFLYGMMPLAAKGEDRGE